MINILFIFVRYGSLNINYCALMIDFSKAFDSVDHRIPCAKYGGDLTTQFFFLGGGGKN